MLGQKDSVLSYVCPELLNTIMGLRTKLFVPTKCISVFSLSWWSFDLLGRHQPTKSCQSKLRKKNVSAWVCHTQTTVTHVSFASIVINYTSILQQHYIHCCATCQRRVLRIWMRLKRCLWQFQSVVGNYDNDAAINADGGREEHTPKKLHCRLKLLQFNCN